MNKAQEIIAQKIRELTDLLPLITTLEEQLIENPRDMNFITDTVFLTRKSEEILQALRKSLNTLSSKVEQQACLVFAATNERKYSNDTATISPNGSLYVKFPTSPDDPEFADFVKQLPVNAIRPHYPTVQELVMESVDNTGQLPFGLKDIQGVTLKVRCTTKREL